MEIPVDGLRLNVGCGDRRLDGWVGVDAVRRVATDIVADAAHVPLPDGCARELMALHLWEHFYRWQCDDVIVEWRRLLRAGGRLVLELPDIVKCCRNLLEQREGKHPDQLGMWGIYGDNRTCDPFMAHKWGWSFHTLKPFLAEHGFVKVKEYPTQFHPVGRGVRDFRIEAIRA